MNEIQLHGELAKFGTGFSMDVGSPIEAFQALAMQLPEFRRVFRDGNYVAVREDRTGKYIVDERMLNFNQYGTTIHFCPQVEGAGGNDGTLKTIIGVTIAVGSLFIPGAQAQGAIMLTKSLSLQTAGLLVGASLALTGASMLLAPQPKIGKESEGDQSFLFSDDIKAAGQDFTIPITYGRDMVTGIIVSSEVQTNQIGVGVSSTYDGTTAYDPARADVAVY